MEEIEPQDREEEQPANRTSNELKRKRTLHDDQLMLM